MAQAGIEDSRAFGADDLTERVIAAIESEIPRSRVQIHCDPEGGK